MASWRMCQLMLRAAPRFASVPRTVYLSRACIRDMSGGGTTTPMIHQEHSCLSSSDVPIASNKWGAAHVHKGLSSSAVTEIRALLLILHQEMDAILNCTEESMGPDYYTLLGCDELSTVEQIIAEYKVRALECHPDKHPRNQKAVEEFQKLQQAKDTLTNEESRAHYDYWRRSKIMIPYTQWEALQDSIKMSMHWAVRNKKEAMLEAPNKPSDGAQDDIINDAEEKNNPLSSEIENYILEEPQENIDLLSPKSPEGSPDMTYCLLRFRWSAEAPSDLLRKFRNYEI